MISSVGQKLSSSRWLWLALVLFHLFFLLGHRALNEPDEGRYAEIAREMLESRNWLVPHLWYVPHLDKPPFTYWAVAASLRWLGQNEWAVRLPLALAGLSGILAACALGQAMGGRRTGRWSALILAGALLYFGMARMLTPDMLVTQFIAWAGCFLWLSWRCLGEEEQTGPPQGFPVPWRFLVWHAAAWTAMSLGFLTKGPIALAVPLVAFLGLLLYRRPDFRRGRTLALGLLVGLAIFCVVALPWFFLVFQQLPEAFNYMTKGQVVGHALGTTIKNRSGHPLYFFGVLAVGFLPWSVLLGWLWRRAHWRSLTPAQREGWLYLTIWIAFTFTVFSLSRAKLPAYILPLFPPLAVLAGWRWFATESGEETPPTPRWLWPALVWSGGLLLAVLPLAVWFAYRRTDLVWPWGQIVAAIVATSTLGLASRKWTPVQCGGAAMLLALLNGGCLGLALPTVETSLRSNQTLKPLGLALRREYRPGTILVCWGSFPQGLPFYSQPVIHANHRPLMGDLNYRHVPFEFTGNRERLRPRLLPDEAALDAFLRGTNRVLVVGYQGTFQRTQSRLSPRHLRLITQVGRWELFANRVGPSE